MVLDVLAEEGWIWETEAVADLLDAQVRLLQIVADVFQNLFCNPFVGSLAGILLADGREVFGRNTKFASVGIYRMALYFTGMQ